jgi:site-specific recombinase XerD
VKGRMRRFVDYARYARRWKAALGNRTLRQIGLGDVERYIAKRRDDGMSDASCNRELTFLRSVFYMAKGDGLVDDVPFGKGSGKVKLFKENNQRVRFLSDEEETALRKAIGEDEWPKVAFALLTGFRQGNQFRLRADVKFDTVTVCTRKPKGRKDYHVPMNDELRAILGALPSRLRSEWVFPSETGETPLDPKNYVHRVFGPAVEKAGLEDFHWHDLRHSFASRLVMAGVDLRTVQDLMGHATAQMTQRYAHVSDAHKLDAVQRLSKQAASDARTDTTTDTSKRPAKVAAQGGAEALELPREESEPCWIRTSDPLLKSGSKDDDENHD